MKSTTANICILVGQEHPDVSILSFGALEPWNLNLCEEHATIRADPHNGAGLSTSFPPEAPLHSVCSPAPAKAVPRVFRCCSLCIFVQYKVRATRSVRSRTDRSLISASRVIFEGLRSALPIAWARRRPNRFQSPGSPLGGSSSQRPSHTSSTLAGPHFGLIALHGRPSSRV